MDKKTAALQLGLSCEAFNRSGNTLYVHGLQNVDAVLDALDINKKDIDGEMVQRGEEGILGAEFGNRFQICGADNMKRMEEAGVLDIVALREARAQLLKYTVAIDRKNQSAYVQHMPNADETLGKLGITTTNVTEEEAAAGKNGILGIDAMGNRFHIVGAENFACMEELNICHEVEHRPMPSSNIAELCTNAKPLKAVV